MQKYAMAARPQRPKATKIYSESTKKITRESQKRLEWKHQLPPSDAAGPQDKEFQRQIKSRTSTARNKTASKSTKTNPTNTQSLEKKSAQFANGNDTSKTISRTTRLPTAYSERILDSDFSNKEHFETSEGKSSASSSAFSKGASDKQIRKLTGKGGLEIKHEEQLQPSGQRDTESTINNSGRSPKHLKNKDQFVNGIPNEPKVTKAGSKALKNQKSLTNKSLKVMILNMKGRDDRNGAIAERRRHIFQNVIQKHLPGLVLVQDFKLPSITTKFWSNSPLPSQYSYTGTEDTGIMFDETVVDIQDVPIAEFRNTMDGLHRHANNKLKRIVPVEFDPFSRMCSKLVTMKQGASVNFICISWRGEFYIDSNKLKHSQKLEYFEYLMEFLRIVKEKLKIPILIGGNFYVDLYSIEHLVQPPFQLCIYDASMRRTVPGIIDYFIITEDLVLTDITWVSLREDTTAYQPTGVMDHDPVRAVLSGNPGKGKGPQRMVNPNKWNSTKVSEGKK